MADDQNSPAPPSVFARLERYKTLGAASVAGLQSNRYASVWNPIGYYLYEHGDRFCHFEGLRSFKRRFDPVWSPNCLAVPRGASAPNSVLEVNGLVSGGMRGLLKQS